MFFVAHTLLLYNCFIAAVVVIFGIGGATYGYKRRAKITIVRQAVP